MTTPTVAAQIDLDALEKPTEGMIVAGMEASVLGRPSVDDEYYVLSIWSAMLNAAPKPAGQAEPVAEPDGYVVIDDFGQPSYSASYASACHEYINEAIIEHGHVEAATWKVRPYYFAPQPKQAPSDDRAGVGDE